MQAWHKAEKAKGLKKAKAEKAKLRTEKLARKNPDRIARQIGELKLLEESGEIKAHEKKVLEELERELVGVKKAREALGVKEDEGRRIGEEGVRGGRGATEGARGRGGGRGRGDSSRGGGFGERDGRGGFRAGTKRGRDTEDSDSGESTSSSVRDIPMPSGTPPPLPPRQHTRQRFFPPPLGQPDRLGPREPHALPPKPVMPAPVVTYSAAPIVRDLRKEAAAFVPAAVKLKQLEAGRKKEKEMLAREETEGEGPTGPGSYTEGVSVNAAPEVGEESEDEVMDEEYERFRREMEVEEVEDEGI